MWDVGRRVEKPVDAVAAVAAHHGEAVGLSVLLDDVPQLPVAHPGLHCGRGRHWGQTPSHTKHTAAAARLHTRVDGLHQAFVRRLHQPLGSFLHLAHEEGLIQVAMETVMVDSDVHCRRQTCLTQLGQKQLTRSINYWNNCRLI